MIYRTTERLFSIYIFIKIITELIIIIIITVCDIKITNTLLMEGGRDEKTSKKK
jgi:hypothetical protein